MLLRVVNHLGSLVYSVGKLRGLQPQIYTNNMVYILKRDLIGSSKIQTWDLSVLSLTRYRALVISEHYTVKLFVALFF